MFLKDVFYTEHDMNCRTFLIIAVVFLGAGCASARRPSSLAVEGGNLLNTSKDEDLYDAATALGSVAGAWTGGEMTEAEMREAAKRLQNDTEAKSAIEAISTSFKKDQVRVKYSPATGKRYSADLEYDPETGVKLLPVE
ncbi:MAG TPA: hypothetical protein P5246_03860 [Candidatus Omnitrophota bacterium]|nr:hypothetical protein [Candidatus Omnitrophota bacterium]